jgi:hypothetical protein
MGISQEYDAQVRALSGSGQQESPNRRSFKGPQLKKFSSTLLTFVVVFATTLTLVQNSASLFGMSNQPRRQKIIWLNKRGPCPFDGIRF